MKAEKYDIQCYYCGRFIALDDFDNDLAGYELTHDTHFAAEMTEHFHRKCKSKSDIWNDRKKP